MMCAKKEQEEKKDPRIVIHTTISEEAKGILDKYSKKTDEKNKKATVTKRKILEEALDLYEKYHESGKDAFEDAMELYEKFQNPEKDDAENIWMRFRNELDMVSVGKTTFLAYISGDYSKAIKENVSVEILEWYLGKTIDKMSLEEVLKGLKALWMAGNYFNQIDIVKNKGGAYMISFHHNFRSKRYGEFWGEYFSALLRQHQNCKVEVFIRNESFVLNIFPFHKKINTQD